MTKTIIEHGIRVYKNHFCKHCGERIPVRESHEQNGIPEYIHGHHPTKNQFKKGHYVSLKHRKKLSESLKGHKLGLGNKYAFKDGLTAFGHYVNHSRNRGLGFIPMNNPFPNCEMHHLDKEVVMFIPTELHKSIPHSLETGKNMTKINDLAYAWFNEQT